MVSKECQSPKMYDEIIKKYKDKIKKIYKCSEDRLFTETLIELQIIRDMLKGSDK